MSKKYDHLITHPHTDFPEMHNAPPKRSAKIIAAGFLIILALFALVALAIGFSN